MEKKKTKLTISGSSKKTMSNIEIAKTQGKNSVLIQKKSSRYTNKSNFGNKNKKPYFSPKTSTFPKKSVFSKPSINPSNDFEKRKLAEQRATKRLKGETPTKSKEGKAGSKRRELKLTVSRALNSEDIETKGRSLASLRRAKQKYLRDKIIKFREDELHHKDIAYENGATKKGIYSFLDKIIKTGSKLAINISEKI